MSKSFAQKKLNQHATTVILGVIFLFFSVLLYLSLCTMPCEYENRERRAHAQQRATKEKTSKPYTSFLVVVIPTSPHNFRQRDACRETWLSGTTREDVLKYFVLGTGDLKTDVLEALQLENSTHGDLLVFPDLKDSYYSLTDKILKTFVWLDSNVNFQYVFKGDDDTFARLDIMMNELRHAKQKRLYWGFFDGRARVKKRGKWVEKKWILCDTYVPHALGGGYVLSADLVHYIAQNAQLLQPFISEDVSVGAWLGALNIYRKHDPRFDTEYKSRGCFNDYIVTHKQNAASMKEKYFRLQETGLLCRTEQRVRRSYIYDWDAKPSLCCVRNDSKVH